MLIHNSRMVNGAEQLKDWMERRGFNLKETADYFGWDMTFISKLTNARRNPGLGNAIKIERLTGIPVEAWSASELDESVSPSVELDANYKQTK